MKSLFKKLYSYRKKEFKNEKENFLTEIFAYCLQIEKQFLIKLLTELKINSKPKDNNYIVSTQETFELGRPDITIKWDDTTILIECKVGSPLNIEQLERYTNILKKFTTKNKHLIFISKYHETEIPSNVLRLRWNEIYSIIPTGNLICNQMKKYLKEEKMNSILKFDVNDNNSLLTIVDTINKMDEILDFSKKYFEEKTNIKLTSKSDRFKKFKEYAYKDYRWITYNHNNIKYIYCINIGFTWHDQENTYFHFDWWLPNTVENNNILKIELLNSIKTEFNIKSVKFEEAESIGFSYTLADYLNSSNQIKLMKNNVKSWIDHFIEFNLSHNNKFLK